MFFRDIYPPEFEFNLEGSAESFSFLDLYHTKSGRKLKVKLFDKRNAFTISIG